MGTVLAPILHLQYLIHRVNAGARATRLPATLCVDLDLSSTDQPDLTK